MVFVVYIHVYIYIFIYSLYGLPKQLPFNATGLPQALSMPCSKQSPLMYTVRTPSIMLDLSWSLDNGGGRNLTMYTELDSSCIVYML